MHFLFIFALLQLSTIALLLIMQGILVVLYCNVKDFRICYPNYLLVDGYNNSQPAVCVRLVMLLP